jgi:simple sugar transport system substrate-binding protein
VLHHSWKAKDYRYGAKYGYLQLSSFGPAVPQAVRKDAFDLLNKIKNGSFVVFKGPIKSRDGSIEVPAGKVADTDNAFLQGMNWLVEGVYGSANK